MKLSISHRPIAFLVLAALALYALDAHAAITSAGVLDRVLGRFRDAASGWADVFMTAATWLFWALAAISLAFTFGFMLLRRADLSEFFTELVRFIMTTGFFLWLMVNATDFVPRILNGLRQLAGQAGNLSSGALTPSGVVDIGFAIFFKICAESSGWAPIDSLVGMAVGIVILVMLVMVGTNILLVLIGSWMLTYGGLIYLGFGGGRWTSDMAIGYYRTALKVGIELMTMVLLVAIGKTFLDDYYRDLGGSTRITDLAVVLVASLILLVLVNRVPPLLSSVASGGPVGGTGLGGVGAGALMGGAGMGLAAAAAGASLMGAAAAHAMGGFQALQAAFQATGGGAGAGAGGGSTGAGGASGASGSSGGGGMPGLGWTGGSGGGSGGGGSPNPSNGGGSGSPFANAAGFGSGFGGTGAAGKSTSAGAGAGGRPSFGQRMAAVSEQLKRGAQSVAADRARESGASFVERVAETPGAKVAQAIRAANGLGTSAADDSSIFGADSLSPGADDNVFDPEAEVAAFTAGAEPAPPAWPAQGTVDDEGMFDSQKG
ncbi:P-type conjugative transfer protein TrbL [Azohydromonas caseinilytica]|uniref:P-type conjugative transfer protein TrbL n=1 Tax=Azohydromonas caseinilytica TaxID=2728836 RepID=A0A848FDE0_9BURK|nr:P-type conjugative transfer protein TrbL [Azohydromonas caseinilytica]NML17016.1 P-type conjugative transfer protein TrbL [Azohydromonas caseinilytica]